MKTNKLVALAAVLVVGMAGTGYYVAYNNSEYALTKEEITATDKRDSLESLYQLARGRRTYGYGETSQRVL